MELVKPVEPVLWASIVELVIGGTGYGTVEALGSTAIWEGEKARVREEGEVNIVFRGLSIRSERTFIWPCENLLLTLVRCVLCHVL